MYITDTEKDIPTKYQAVMKTPNMTNLDISSFLNQLAIKPFSPTTLAILCQYISTNTMSIANATVRKYISRPKENVIKRINDRS